jgi:DNA-binding CsgD family transcriptional regulator
VLLQMIDGRTADEIAGDLAVSVETTRSHIRSIYGKLNVSSREAMFRRIQPFLL